MEDKSDKFTEEPVGATRLPHPVVVTKPKQQIKKTSKTKIKITAHTASRSASCAFGPPIMRRTETNGDDRENSILDHCPENSLVSDQIFTCKVLSNAHAERGNGLVQVFEGVAALWCKVCSPTYYTILLA